MVQDITFTFMHLADAFIQSDLQCIQAIHVFSVRIEPTTFVLLTQCSTTEPQEHYIPSTLGLILHTVDSQKSVIVGKTSVVENRNYNECIFCVPIYSNGNRNIYIYIRVIYYVPRTPHGGLSDTSVLEIRSGGGGSGSESGLWEALIYILVFLKN